MDSPGGGTGVRRIAEARTASLKYPLSPQVINTSPYYERYWYSWRRLRYLVSVIKARGIENRGEWLRLRAIIGLVSVRKRAYLFRELQPLLSPGSIAFLFAPEEIPGMGGLTV